MSLLKLRTPNTPDAFQSPSAVSTGVLKKGEYTRYAPSPERDFADNFVDATLTIPSYGSTACDGIVYVDTSTAGGTTATTTRMVENENNDEREDIKFVNSVDVVGRKGGGGGVRFGSHSILADLIGSEEEEEEGGKPMPRAHGGGMKWAKEQEVKEKAKKRFEI